MTDADVIVVGAGFAGMSAARALAEAGLKVVVHEARNRVGGRTHTVERSGVTLDLGGQWIGPGQSHIAALADELGVDTYPQYDDGDDVVVRAGTVVRVASPALAFAKEELLGYLELVAALEALADTVPTDAPWQAPKA
ncbi:MAG: flavin monoamine oxidase family protein, partial [Candidatus Neomicrothrix subdominans]